MIRRAAFIDRDGTLIEEAGYLNDLGRLRLFPYSIDAVRQLSRAGFAIVIVTNQSGVARGIVSESFIQLAHDHLRKLFEAGGATIDRFYYCPHHPSAVIETFKAQCTCRKPLPGLWHQAAMDLDLDLSGSFTVGDRWQDIQAGHAAGTRTVLVRTGYGRVEELESRDITADTVADNLASAAGWILQQA